MAGTPLQIVVGLGNPGPEHRLTRHNAGFWWLDMIASQQRAAFKRESRFQGAYAKVSANSSARPPISKRASPM